MVGVPVAGEDVRLHTLPLHFEKVLTGSHGGESQPDLDIPKYTTLYNIGKLKLNEFITNRYSLEQINNAIEDMRQGKTAGRCILNISKD